jgi:hypothetical protein
LGLSLVIACGGSQNAPPPQAKLDNKPPPVRPGVPPPNDEAGFRTLLVGDVAYGGLWFGDATCQAQFGAAGTIHSAAFDAFAHCVAGLRLRPNGRADAFDDTSVLTDDHGFEVEARVVRGQLNFIGFSARAPGWSDVPSITPGALELLRTAGDPNATITDDEARRLGWSKGGVHFRVCLGEDGQVSSGPGSASSVASLAAFSPIVRTWKFQPFVVEGKAIAVCAIVGLQYPATPADENRERLPQPPHFSKAGHVVYDVDPRKLDELRIEGGDKHIYPDPDDRSHINRERLIGSFLLCVDETGHYERGTLLKSTGLRSYDAKIARGIMHWVFRPYVVDGQAIPVCTAYTFIYTQH